jgi:AmmeMemoRadiSam system protein A
MDLSPQQRSRLLDLAYDTLVEYITACRIPEARPDDPALTQCAGAFVTLTRRGKLRGCIGHVNAEMALYRAVQQMAIAAATTDPRFPPLRPDELEDLEIEISVLSPVQRIRNIEDLEAGKHGLIITKGRHRGLLLPQVAVEHRMNRYAFADAVCWKAGLLPGFWRLGATMEVFTAEVFGKTFRQLASQHTRLIS